jgi:hypothetical protein
LSEMTKCSAFFMPEFLLKMPYEGNSFIKSSVSIISILENQFSSEYRTKDLFLYSI